VRLLRSRTTHDDEHDLVADFGMSSAERYAAIGTMYLSVACPSHSGGLRSPSQPWFVNLDNGLTAPTVRAASKQLAINVARYPPTL
jgi:hypothetical protein